MQHLEFVWCRLLFPYLKDWPCDKLGKLGLHRVFWYSKFIKIAKSVLHGILHWAILMNFVFLWPPCSGLAKVLRLQTAWCWKTREQLGFLEELLQRFKAFSAGLVDDGKGGFALNFYTQVSCRQWKVFLLMYYCTLMYMIICWRLKDWPFFPCETNQQAVSI